ncbi:hypothetical protein D3C72_1677870 [compost metagenome]
MPGLVQDSLQHFLENCRHLGWHIDGVADVDHFLSDSPEPVAVSKQVLHEHCVQISDDRGREALKRNRFHKELDSCLVIEQHHRVRIIAGGPFLEQFLGSQHGIGVAFQSRGRPGQVNKQLLQYLASVGSSRQLLFHAP